VKQMHYSSEIAKAAESLGIHCVQYAEETAATFHKLLRDTLQITKSPDKPLWQYLSNVKSYSVHNPDGWKKMGSFIGAESVIVFFDEFDDPSILYMEPQGRFSDVIGECTGFVFYVLSLKSNDLYCFNDHDYLIIVNKLNSLESIPAILLKV
jgi:hypothetical protein